MTPTQSVDSNRSPINLNLQNALPTSNRSNNEIDPSQITGASGIQLFSTREGLVRVNLDTLPDAAPVTPDAARTGAIQYAGEERLIGNLAREVQTRAEALRRAETEYEAAKRALDSTPQSQGGGGCFGGGATTNPAWTTANATLDRATTALNSAAR